MKEKDPGGVRAALTASSTERLRQATCRTMEALVEGAAQ